MMQSNSFSSLLSVLAGVHIAVMADPGKTNVTMVTSVKLPPKAPATTQAPDVKEKRQILQTGVAGANDEEPLMKHTRHITQTIYGQHTPGLYVSRPEGNDHAEVRQSQEVGPFPRFVPLAAVTPSTRPTSLNTLSLRLKRPVIPMPFAANGFRLKARRRFDRFINYLTQSHS